MIQSKEFYSLYFSFPNIKLREKAIKDDKIIFKKEIRVEGEDD